MIVEPQRQTKRSRHRQRNNQSATVLIQAKCAVRNINPDDRHARISANRDTGPVGNLRRNRAAKFAFRPSALIPIQHLLLSQRIFLRAGLVINAFGRSSSRTPPRMTPCVKRDKSSRMESAGTGRQPFSCIRIADPSQCTVSRYRDRIRDTSSRRDDLDGISNGSTPATRLLSAPRRRPHPPSRFASGLTPEIRSALAAGFRHIEATLGR